MCDLDLWTPVPGDADYVVPRLKGTILAAKSVVPEPEVTGNCFMNCGRYMMGNPGTDAVLVHCIALGTGGEAEGLEYTHAYLSLNGVIAMDLTKNPDNPMIVPLDAYRKGGSIMNEIEYTYEETMEKLREFKHWGAWDETLQFTYREAA